MRAWLILVVLVLRVPVIVGEVSIDVVFGDIEANEAAFPYLVLLLELDLAIDVEAIFDAREVDGEIYRIRIKGPIRGESSCS